MQKHKHADTLLAIAKGEQVQVAREDWTDCSASDALSIIATGAVSPESFRIKPRTVRIGNYDVPEPIRKAPEMGSSYWHIAVSYSSLASHATWRGDSIDMERLARGVIHSTVENAVSHATAIISLTAISQHSAN